MLTTTPFVLLALAAWQDPPVEAAAPVALAPPVITPDSLVLDLGEGWLPLVVPRDEELVFTASVSAVAIETTLGTVSLTSGVDEYKPGLLIPSAAEQAHAGADTGWLKAHAKGRHLLYEMDAFIETRFLPQAWPAIKHKYEHRGTENRQREILLGEKRDAQHAKYRSQSDWRGWGPIQTRAIPETGALETMGAIYMMRAMIAERRDEVTFPMLTKLRLWQVTLTRGVTGVVETEAGTFDAVKVVLSTARHPDNPDTIPDEEFEGLFGIHGSIDIWVCASTGVPVRVVGDIPAGPIQIRADMLLHSYRGTPEAFAPRATGE